MSLFISFCLRNLLNRVFRVIKDGLYGEYAGMLRHVSLLVTMPFITCRSTIDTVFR